VYITTQYIVEAVNAVYRRLKKDLTDRLCIPWSGFHTELGGGLDSPPAPISFPPLPHPTPTPEILKLSMVIIVLSQVLSNNLVPDCNLRGSFFGRACPQIPLVGTHLRVHERAFAALSSCYHPIPPPPHPKSCMKPWFSVLHHCLSNLESP